MDTISRSSVDQRTPLLLAACLGGISLAIWSMASAKLLLVFLCFLVSSLIGLVAKTISMLRDSPSQPRAVELLLELSRDSEIGDIHLSTAESLKRTANQHDPIFRKLAVARLQSIAAECRTLGAGVIEFTSTESWRVTYEELLRSPGLHLYRSVSYIESAHYWQDGPGQQSTQLNLELQDAGVITIERTAIIADHLWLADELFPIDPLHSWLDQQHRYGIMVRLLRESTLEHDADLLCDFGIYGSRAVGMQVADPAGRTIRFALDFNFEKVQEAESKWRRLSVYATSYRELLDQQH